MHDAIGPAGPEGETNVLEVVEEAVATSVGAVMDGLVAERPHWLAYGHHVIHDERFLRQRASSMGTPQSGVCDPHVCGYTWVGTPERLTSRCCPCAAASSLQLCQRKPCTTLRNPVGP